MSNLKIIDVHTHQFFYDDYESVYKENLEKNVVLIIENGLNFETNRKVIELSRKYNNVYYALGIHPTDIVKIDEQEFDKIIEQIYNNKGNNKFLAIGEIGLDFYWIKDKDLINLQIERFRTILDTAEELNKPVIVHSRKAEKEVIDILETYNIEVILHSFWKPKLVNRSIENGFYISIPAFVYRDNGLQKIAREYPLELILTETDSPFLDPTEKRNNKSWKIIYGLNTIANLKNIDVLELSEQIINNVKKLFNVQI